MDGAPEEAVCAIDSPFGVLTVAEQGGEIVGLRWGGTPGAPPAGGLLGEAARQLSEYFEERRRVFDLPMRFGEGLQARFAATLVAAPFGETRTYGDLAKALGASAQAVGQCCGANPIPILIPCHRVLAADGLGGFSAPGGIETKVALLRHEGAASLLL